MASRGNGKLRLLYVLDILNQYSDEQHPLNASDIIGHLSKYDISAERKTIYDDIYLLEDYDCSIEYDKVYESNLSCPLPLLCSYMVQNTLPCPFAWFAPT